MIWWILVIVFVVPALFIGLWWAASVFLDDISKEP